MPNADRLMTLFEAIQRRRAVCSYLPDVVDRDTIAELLKAAVRAPTAMHEEPCAFVVVQDRRLLKRYSDLAKSTWAAEHKTTGATATALFEQPDFNIFYDASTLVVIAARSPGPFAVADCWLAAENLMLAACAMGLGTCCIGFAVPVLNQPDVKAELGIPADAAAIAPIIVGNPRGDTPQTSRKPPTILSWRTA